ncbi:MAG: nuclear transport factor 2 family protein [Chloroflexota bacterium]|nr:nuclear transport factor 2 family protein [Chloroflexota bacterium]
MPTSQGRAFYEQQIAYLQAKDVDGLIDNHYNADAVLISFDNKIKGRDALKAYFRGYLELLGRLEVKSTDNFAETEDVIYFTATVESALGEARVYDAFILRDGKISYHISGVMR